MRPATERREIHFSGRVQGVGFRYTTLRCAQGFSVTGFVRNLPDGRVQAVVEGESGEIDRFCTEIHQRLGDYIHQTVQQQLDSSGEFHEFGVRY